MLAETFSYRDRSLLCEGVELATIAKKAGTPCYVYSSDSIRTRFQAYEKAFGDTPHTVCYAVKANSNLAILKLLANEGAGFDIVSGGELFRVLKAGGDPAKVVFSGVGKTADEVEYALQNGIHSFNCESDSELALIDSIAARLRVKARVALRVNPDIKAETHPYISTGMREHKFGIDIAIAEKVYRDAAALPNLLPEAVSCHIGSQLLDTVPILDAVDRVLELVDKLRSAGLPIQSLDLGGGIGVAYQPSDSPPAIAGFIQEVCRRASGRNLKLMIEPGRSIVGESGMLLTRVLYRKRNADKEFVIIDAAMNDLIRPALYKAHHDIVPLREAPERGMVRADIVGPVCESGDFLARDRDVANVFPGDYLGVCTAGAYGFVQSSNYNARPRPAEVLVEGTTWRIIRARETYADLVRGE